VTRLRLLTAGLVALALIGVPLGAQRMRSMGRLPDVTVRTQPDKELGTTRLRLGMTHTEYSIDPWSRPSAAKAADTLLSGRRWMQNQHIMGWGALNPEPSPGVYDFTSLDRRIDLIRRTGGIPVITLCCAPDWMKGGRAGETDWSQLEEAPAFEHYGDFADLAARIARRYPDVRYYQVWNELKGFYDEEAQRWDAVGYTDLYNKVYEKLKEVNPKLQVGGPYATLDSERDLVGMRAPSRLRGRFGIIDQRSIDVIDYWLEHKKGADFIALDAATTDKDGKLATDPFTASEKFVTVAAWVRARTDLPIWWAEWYVLPAGAEHWDLERQSAVMTVALAKMATSGASAELVWEPQADGRDCEGCLWSDTRMDNGGQPTPAMLALDGFRSAFPPGTALVQASVSSGDLTVMASRSQALLVNHAARELVVDVDGNQVVLGPYQTLVTRLPGGQRS
jgi:hypothetical protein